MKQLLKDPRIQISTTLFLIFLSAVFYYHRADYLKHLLTAVGSAIFFDFVFLKIRKIDLFIPTAALTTGLIVSLLLAPTVPFYEVIMTSGFAMLSKNFIKGVNRHVFNPAAFGIFLVSLNFQHLISWWGVSFQPQTSPYFLVLLLPAIISVVRLKRYKIILSFLAFFSILNYWAYLKPIQNIIFDPTILFFSLVMLPEPQTSPNKPLKQILFGVFIASLSFLPGPIDRETTLIPHGGYDPLLFALLAGNLFFYRLK